MSNKCFIMHRILMPYLKKTDSDSAMCVQWSTRTKTHLIHKCIHMCNDLYTSTLDWQTHILHLNPEETCAHIHIQEWRKWADSENVRINQPISDEHRNLWGLWCCQEWDICVYQNVWLSSCLFVCVSQEWAGSIQSKYLPQLRWMAFILDKKLQIKTKIVITFVSLRDI